MRSKQKGDFTPVRCVSRKLLQGWRGLGVQNIPTYKLRNVEDTSECTKALKTRACGCTRILLQIVLLSVSNRFCSNNLQGWKFSCACGPAKNMSRIIFKSRSLSWDGKFYMQYNPNRGHVVCITTRTVDAFPYIRMAEVLEPFVAFEWSQSFLSSKAGRYSTRQAGQP